MVKPMFRSLDLSEFSPSEQAIVLKRLRSFKSDQIGLGVLPLIERFSIPNCTEVVLWINHWPESAFNTIQRALSTALSNLPEGGATRQPPCTMTFDYQYGVCLRITVTVPAQLKRNIDITIWANSGLTKDKILAWITSTQSHLPEGYPTTSYVALHRSEHGLSGSDIVPIICSIRNIKSIIVDRWGYGELEPILEALSEDNLESLEKISFKLCRMKNVRYMLDLVERRPSTEIWWRGSRKNRVIRIDLAKGVVKKRETRQARLAALRKYLQD